MRRWQIAKNGEFLFWCLVGLPLLSALPAAAAYFTVSNMMFPNPPPTGVTNDGSVETVLMILMIMSLPISVVGLVLGFVPGAICAATIRALSRRPHGMTIFEPILVGLFVPASLGFILRPLTPVQTWFVPAQSWSVPAAFGAGGLVAVLLMLIIGGVRRIFVTAAT